MMPQVLFIALVAVAAAFFVWRMKVDPMAIAFGASTIYFTPGFLGVAQFSYGRGLDSYSEPIVPGAYGAMGLVVAVVTATTLVVDRIPAGHQIRIGFDARIPAVLLAFAIVAGAISIHNIGVYYLCLDKEIILSRLDPAYFYASLSIPFCIATAYVLRQWPIVALGVLGLFADLYAGFRGTTAIAFLACTMLTGHWALQGWRKSVAFAMIVVFCGGALFIVKHLIVPVKYAAASYCDAQLALDAKLAAEKRKSDSEKKPAAQLPPAAATPPAAAAPPVAAVRPAELDRVAPDGRESKPAPPLQSTVEKLSATAKNFSRPEFYFFAFVTQSEAFVIQSMLNEVVRTNFRTDAGYLIGQLLTGLPLGATLFGIDSSGIRSFDTMAQPALFPRVRFGMANNPWAQAYAAGGQWMVACFALGYALIAAMLTVLFYKTAGALRAAVAVIAAWICFYFHRNDLYIEVILIKHVVYIFGASVLVAGVWDWIVRRLLPARRAG